MFAISFMGVHILVSVCVCVCVCVCVWCVYLLQVYYGNAIRANSNNLASMKTACWAVFYHSISTDKKPQNEFCPVGV